MSQDLPLKCWDTSHCLKTTCSSVGKLSTVPSLPFKGSDTSHCPKTSHSSVGTLSIVPRPFVQVLGHFALSQDPSIKRWDTSHCPKTSLFKCWDNWHYPKTSHSSGVTLSTVPRPLNQVLAHFALSQDPSSKCWDSRISSVLGQSDLSFFSVRIVGSLIF